MLKSELDYENLPANFRNWMVHRAGSLVLTEGLDKIRAYGRPQEAFDDEFDNGLARGHFCICTERAYGLVADLYRKKDWRIVHDGDGVEIDYPLVTLVWSHLGIKLVVVYHDIFDVDLYRLCQTAPILPKKEEPKVVPKLGTPEWPDDVVLEKICTEDDSNNTTLGFYFPDVGEKGYRHIDGGWTVEVGYMASASLAEAMMVSSGKVYKWKILIPEQAFNRLGVFSLYLGQQFGLGGYGEQSVADLVELRKQLYQQWLQQNFPHFFKKEEPEVKTEVNPEGAAGDCQHKYSLVLHNGFPSSRIVRSVSL